MDEVSVVCLQSVVHAYRSLESMKPMDNHAISQIRSWIKVTLLSEAMRRPTMEMEPSRFGGVRISTVIVETRTQANFHCFHSP